MVGSELREHGEVLVQLSHKVLFASPLIAIDAHHTDTVITRVALQVFLGSQIGSHSRRIRPEQVVEAVGIQLILQHIP